jgi:hypothetical protein
MHLSRALQQSGRRGRFRGRYAGPCFSRLLYLGGQRGFRCRIARVPSFLVRCTGGARSSRHQLYHGAITSAWSWPAGPAVGPVSATAM